MKPIIYQILTRLFGNKNEECKLNGNRDENGVGKMDDISEKALSEIHKLGITHIWYTGIIEHALVKGYPDCDIPDGNPLVIKGKAGSPYAIKDYYDVNPDLAVDADKRIEEFQDLIERTHQANMKVIIDFIPNHLAREYYSDKKPLGIVDFGKDDDNSKAFDRDNNFYYMPNENLYLPDSLLEKHPIASYSEKPAKATGNDIFSAYPSVNDWYETVKLNYGIDYLNGRNKHFDPIPDTWLKMEQVISYWAAMGVDAFRCDMVEMVPVEFWNWLISVVKLSFPNLIFIAEVYDPQKYDSYIEYGKFDYLYDKVGLYDTLKRVIQGDSKTSDISQCWQNLNGKDAHMLRFLENHDEQRIASAFFAGEPTRAIPAMFIVATLNKGPIMLYFGQEVGEAADGVSGYSKDDGKTTLFDYWRVPQYQKWMNDGKFDGGRLLNSQKELRKSYHDILNIAQKDAVVNGEFYDLMWYNPASSESDTSRYYFYLRYTHLQHLLMIVNFYNCEKEIRVKIPKHAFELMGMPKNGKLRLEANNATIDTITCEEFLNKGKSFKLPKWGYLVCKISSF
ncbi:alpha-amylase [Ancylomarina euxinus]|uniref:Alpha-amylase n=1 Tax=Ancylomarina euxinus TaxID=2283627 RepID=A0A425Y0N9_9BACT|nr:alpha-amylase family protein [Ancylomarina euxinus]MCZ4695233.1 alpha-amylase family protein [Ancylomarina euxinus]MUP15430.1 alpha-amylase [Ancylomarina euxinus]RRG21140.1 alpha-amylase [Ancylomarina euxinus]